MQYGLDDKPGGAALLLYGLQWFIVSLPCVVIMGTVVTRLHYSEIGDQVWYMQKLFIITGLITIVQVLKGHRLPLVVGPATTLLVGITASFGHGPAAIYTSIAIGGILLVLISLSGILARLRLFFTPRIVAVILVLIAFTLAPTILKLIFSGTNPSSHFLFALAYVAVIMFCSIKLQGIWKSLTVFVGLAGGSLIYFILFGFPGLPVLSETANSVSLLSGDFEFNPGVTFAFFFCFIALLINELGSIEAVGFMLKASDMGGRVKRGAVVQGFANSIAGSCGVIGSVDFSLSAGLISATGCASRHCLVPAGIALVLCGFSKDMILLLTCLPGPVTGALLLYLMSTQLAGGLQMLAKEKAIGDFNASLTVGLPLMLALLVSFAPPQVFSGLPEFLKPLLANGFVMGTLAVIILEHCLFKK